MSFTVQEHLWAFRVQLVLTVKLATVGSGTCAPYQRVAEHHNHFINGLEARRRGGSRDSLGKRAELGDVYHFDSSLIRWLAYST